MLNSSMQEEFNTILSLEDNESDEYFLVEASWVRKWVNYLHGDKAPGPLRTKKLLDKKTQKLRKRIKLGKDYRAFNDHQWNLFKSKYGSEQPILCPFSLNNRKYSESVPISAEEHKEKVQLSRINEISGDCDDVDFTEDDFPEFFERPPTWTESTELTSNEAYQSRRRASSNIGAPIFGLLNPGVYCYINSALELLISIVPLERFLVSEDKKGKEAFHALSEFFKRALSMKKGVLRPTSIWVFGSKNFAPELEHDMPEFMRFLLDALDEEIGEQNPIALDIFNGQFASTLTCRVCDFTSTKLERFTDIQLQMTESIEKCFESFCSREVLEGEAICENCQSLNLVKSIIIERSPNYLLIELKRFCNNRIVSKNTNHVKFGKDLSLTRFSDEEAEYSLIGVTVHRGTLSSGHYTSYCKRGREWYYLDDEVTHKVSIKDVLEQPIYVFLYKKI